MSEARPRECPAGPVPAPGGGPRDPSGAFVSVIIPSYNSAAVLPEAIESVLAQSRPADEIIVVDDGSEDDTKDVCRGFGDRVRYLRQDNAGASAARNTGLAAACDDSAPASTARGRHWLAFLDADDIWDPQKLELQFAALAAHPEADFAVTTALAWSPREQSYVEYKWSGSLDPAILRAELLVRNIFSGLCSSILIRRAALLAVGGFAAGRGCEDRRLALDLLERHRALIVDLPLVRQRPGPAHWTDPARHRAEMLRLIDDYAGLFRRLDPSGRLLRRARARVHERSGMHHLENGDLKSAARDLVRATVLRPTLANPWRVLANACLGRLKPTVRAHQSAS